MSRRVPVEQPEWLAMVEEAAAVERAAVELLLSARLHRNALLRQAAEAGCEVKALGRAAELSRAQLYNII